MSRGSAIYSAALLVAIVSIFVAPTLAQILGGVGGPRGLPGTDCMASLKVIEGCVQAFMTSVLRAQIQQIGSVCCRAFLNVSDNCLPEMFPYNPSFPPLFKSYCTTQGQSMSPPSPTNVRANKLN
ncbi:egg cell-secreted-like protein [Actinidia rufa]|uniref:Egg cell-secreted-like protein n=1 Tax=Actinidia rufa TaxID=165716 RepID=A0A7J0DI22_9ERIC|nr:egg cell-secreted-like protein [Actinidia rufa]